MLKRISKIKNIGKFYDCSLGGLEFKDKTIIFGKNGDGKSTLTAILRSLSTGNNDILIGRKSFVSSGNKNIELSFEISSENVVHKFENKSWNSNCKGIEIFDTFFISKNIYDGERIVDRHKANLHQYVIGETGKRLSDEIKGAIFDNYSISDDPYLKCRKIMEAVFKAKYYLELKEDIWQNKGLRSFLDTLSQLKIYSQEKNNRFASLFNDLHVPHHDQNVPEGTSENSQGDLKSILKDTLKLLIEI